jgi:hypothetical protein
MPPYSIANRSTSTRCPTACCSAWICEPLELTALDYFQIQQLVAKYAQYFDTWSNNRYDYADLFAEDGFFAPFQANTQTALACPAFLDKIVICFGLAYPKENSRLPFL